MNIFKKLLLVTVALLLWVGVALYGGLAGWWLSPVAERGDAAQFHVAMVDLIEQETTGNLAYALVSKGEITHRNFLTADEAIDENTLFATASMTKWVTAYAVMTLVENNKLNLDAPITDYMSRWSLPASEYSTSGVSVRHLLSHTSGLVDDLGFGDFQPEEPLPTLVDSLETPRASSGEDVEIKLGQSAGEWRYSGGGYLILQLIIEEVSGQKFADFVSQNVFEVAGMERSTFDYLGDFDNIARPFDEQGEPAPIFQYEALAATGLSSTVNDLVEFVRAHTGSVEGGLSKNYIGELQAPHGRTMGADIWGLGTMLYAPTESGAYVFGHDGANDPAINSAVRINPDTGDALIVLSSGHATLASTIGYHWTLWQTGVP
ncbi:MAG: serine hydrolase domain-containing protein, partial [Pseudomonadota bacterium]